MASIDELSILVSMEVDGVQKTKSEISSISQALGRTTESYEKAKKAAESFVKTKFPKATEKEIQTVSREIADIANIMSNNSSAKLKLGDAGEFKQYKKAYSGAFAAFDKGLVKERGSETFSVRKLKKNFADNFNAQNEDTSNIQTVGEYIKDNINNAFETLNSFDISENIKENGGGTLAEIGVEKLSEIDATAENAILSAVSDLQSLKKDNFKDEILTFQKIDFETFADTFKDYIDKAMSMAIRLSDVFDNEQLQMLREKANEMSEAAVIDDYKKRLSSSFKTMKSSISLNDTEQLANSMSFLTKEERAALLGYAQTLPKKKAKNEDRPKETEQYRKDGIPIEELEQSIVSNAETKKNNAFIAPQVSKAYSELPKNIRKSAEEMAKLQNAFVPNREGGDLEGVAKAIEDIKNKAKPTTEEVQKLSVALGGLTAGERGAISHNANYIDSEKTKQTVKKAPKQQKISNSTNYIGNNVELLNNGLAQVQNVGRKAGDVIKTISKSISSFGNESKKSGNKLGTFLAQIGNIVKYRIIRGSISAITAATKEGISNLYQYSSALNNVDAFHAKSTMDEFASSMLWMKNSAATAVIPILSSLQGIINSIASAFNFAANCVASFLAALSGKSVFTKAIKNQTEFADSVGGSSAKAKELETTLLAFDEINRLNDNSDTGGGGGGGATDYESMFEESALVPQKITDFVNAIKKDLEPAIQKVKDSWLDFLNALEELKNSPFVQYLANVSEKMIALAGTVALLAASGITRVFSAMARGLAEVDDTVMKRLGKSLNEMRLTLNSFSNNKSLQKLDKQISTAISDLTEKAINGFTFGIETLSEALKYIPALVDDLQPAINRVKVSWDVLMKSFDNLKNSPFIQQLIVITEKYLAVMGTKLLDIASFALQVGAAITKGLANADLTPLGNAFDNIRNSLKQLGEDESLNNLFGNILTNSIPQLVNVIATVINSMTDFSKYAIKTVESFINKMQPTFEVVKDRWDGLMTSLNALKASPFGQAIGEISASLQSILSTITLLVASSIGKFFASLSDGLASVDSDTLTSLSTSLDNIRKSILELSNTELAKALDSTLGSLVSSSTKLFIESLTLALNDLSSAMQAIVQLLNGDFNGAWQTMVENGQAHSGKVVEISNKLYDGLSENTKTKINSFWGTIEGWITEVDNKFSISSETTGNNAVKGLTTGITDGIATNSAAITEQFETIPSNIDTALGIQGGISQDFIEKGQFLVDGVKNGIDNGIASNEGGIMSAFEKIGNWFKSIFGIASPSTVFEQYGNFIVEGLRNGIQSGISSITSIFENLAQTLKAPFQSSSWLTVGQGLISGFVSGLRSIHIPTFHVSFSSASVSILGKSFQFPVPNLSFYANGGFPLAGELFIANEAGPEMIGKMGNQNVVANNNQIVEGIKFGVYEAFMSALRTQDNNNNTTPEFNIYLDGKQLEARITALQRQSARSMG